MKDHSILYNPLIYIILTHDINIQILNMKIVHI